MVARAPVDSTRHCRRDRGRGDRPIPAAVRAGARAIGDCAQPRRAVDVRGGCLLICDHDARADRVGLDRARLS